MINNNNTLVIGIAGASGSGKSFLADALHNIYPAESILISQDHYYKDCHDLTYKERCLINYDHPDALDFDILGQHLEQLRQGKAIYHPLYDFTTHLRKPDKQECQPSPIIILEGILIFANPEIEIDLGIFVDTPADLCLIRRLQRDTRERGRSMESVIEQYLQSVRPMFQKFGIKARDAADIIVSGTDNINSNAKKIQTIIENKKRS